MQVDAGHPILTGLALIHFIVTLVLSPVQGADTGCAVGILLIRQHAHETSESADRAPALKFEPKCCLPLAISNLRA